MPDMTDSTTGGLPAAQFYALGPAAVALGTAQDMGRALAFLIPHEAV